MEGYRSSLNLVNLDGSFLPLGPWGRLKLEDNGLRPLKRVGWTDTQGGREGGRGEEEGEGGGEGGREEERDGGGREGGREGVAQVMGIPTHTLYTW